MKRSEVFKSTYMAQADISRPTMLTIASVALEEIGSGQDRETKAVMHFTDERFKPMVVNNYNWTICEEAFGEESDFWRGKMVEVYVDPNVSFGGKRTGGIRLRIPANRAPQANGSILDINQAIAACNAAGITTDQMKNNLKVCWANNNITAAGYNAQRDSGFIAEMIDDLQNAVIDDAPLQVGDIPF